MADQKKSRVKVDTSEVDSDIRQAERRMRSEGESERYYRGRLGSWVSRIGDSSKDREDMSRSADTAHKRMNEAAREGMQLRRGRTEGQELGKRLQEVLDRPPQRRSASKRK